MKSLTKEQSKRKDELLEALHVKGEALTLAVEDVNAAITEAFATLAEPLAEYNTAVDDARAFAEEVAYDIDAYIGDKSEKWQEGDTGQATTAWKEEWENADFSALEIEEPSPIDEPELSAHDNLDTLPDSVE